MAENSADKSSEAEPEQCKLVEFENQNDELKDTKRFSRAERKGEGSILCRNY